MSTEPAVDRGNPYPGVIMCFPGHPLAVSQNQEGQVVGRLHQFEPFV